MAPVGIREACNAMRMARTVKGGQPPGAIDP